LEVEEQGGVIGKDNGNAGFGLRSTKFYFGDGHMAAGGLKAAVAVVSFGALTLAAVAQGKQMTTADYARAESFMDYNVNPLVLHDMERNGWLADGRFWFRDAGPDGITFRLVDPAKGTNTVAFDHAKLALGLAAGTDRRMDAKRLSITAFTLADGDQTVFAQAGSDWWRCDLSGAGVCAKSDAKAAHAGNEGRAGRGEQALFAPSPDGTKAAFTRDWNLWVKDVATGKETALTTDGIEDYGYATDNAGWSHSEKPIILWSPDSKKIATFRQDQRRTGEMYLVPVVVGHPQVQVLKYPLAGDKDVTTIERVVFDVDSAKMVKLKMASDQHRSTICDDITCRGGWDDVQWSPDARHLVFVSTSRDHRQEWLRMADTSTGDVREVMDESVKTFFESGEGKVNWKYLPATNEVLWYSERDGWGQMYLFDLKSGKLKNQITKGDGNVTQVLRVDEAARKLYFLALGKESGRDPYFAHFYSINFDGSGMKLLTPEDANHDVKLSPDGHYFVDVYSTPTAPKVGVIRDVEGKLAAEVAKEDISKLEAAGWVPPMPIAVKARDGKTDLFGFMFRPTNFDETKKYPIVNHVYPGPQTGSCGSRNFAAAHGDLQSLAELGFVVVCIDGMGTPGRSKAFHEAYYGNQGDATIPDQVAGMKELAERYKWIDIDRAGIYGHSGGGSATAAAMFHFPDFFKVGIAESGNHDNRLYEDDWGEKWTGLEVKNADGTSNYDSQANQNYAKNLKGHLLLAHGTMDDNVPMNNTLMVVDALIKANKDFDLLLIPNVPHGYQAAGQYMARRRWDYFVKNLAGDVPPVEYQMKPYAATLRGRGTGPEDEE
jgi:dipeptidyl-peptidase 4